MHPRIMKKEVVIAVLIGLTMGLIITFGLYRVRTSLLPSNSDRPVPQQLKPTPTAEAVTNGADLTVLNPPDGYVSAEADLTVTGSTTPNSYVVLFVNDDDYISTADETGNFSFSVTLDDNSSVLTIHALDESGTVTTVERTVFVTDLFETPQEDAEATTEETTESEE